jgi:hypothetical protein
MHHDFLLDKILDAPGKSLENRFLTSFIINHLLSPKLSYTPETTTIYPAWKLPTTNLDDVLAVLDELVSLISRQNEPLPFETIIFKLTQDKSDLLGKYPDSAIHSFLIISKKIEKNPFNEWGLVTWQSITPKRMSDKIHLVLKKANQPMHFTKIAERINEIGFDEKKANPATIHNELILDNKYVLVGRGIYALKDWGYQPGVVAEVIEQVLKQFGPLTRDEIIEKVLGKRLVKKSTIILSLMNRNKFIKEASKKYSLTS